MEEKETKKTYTPREIADMALEVIAEELAGRYSVLSKIRGGNPNMSLADDRHTAFLAGMAVGIDLQGDGLIPSGGLIAGGPLTLCVESALYSKMEDLLGRPIRPRKPLK